MPVKLYKADMSPAARAAMVAVEIFNVPTEFVDVQLHLQEHLKPEYLKMNPVHTVPVLVDGDLTIHDSHVILSYLADAYGKDDSWYPKDLKQRTLVNQKLFFNITVLFKRLAAVSYPIFLKGAKGIEDWQVKDIEEGYKMLETFLSNTKYIATNNITIADVACFTTVCGLNYMQPINAQSYPKVTAWFKELDTKPYFVKANTPGATAYGNFLSAAIHGK